MTKLYIGKKIVTAWPATQTINRGGQTVEEDGYSVKYEDGYISWSPKQTFEAAYVLIENTDGFAPHELRVAGEYVDLRNNFEKLGAFFATDIFAGLSENDREMLEAQHAMQNLLLAVIEDRLNSFATAAIATGRRDPSKTTPFGEDRVVVGEPQFGQTYAQAIVEGNVKAALVVNEKVHNATYDKLVGQQTSASDAADDCSLETLIARARERANAANRASLDLDIAKSEPDSTYRAMLLTLKSTMSFVDHNEAAELLIEAGRIYKAQVQQG